MIDRAHDACSRTASRSTRCIRRSGPSASTRRGADDRGRHPPRRSPRTSTSCWRPSEARHADGEPADRRQPARELDLVRLRRHGARHRHRAAAGADATRSRWRSCRRRRRRRRRPCCSCCCSAATPLSAQQRRQASPASRRRRCSRNAAREADAAARSSARAAPAAQHRRVPQRCRAALADQMRGELAALIDEGKNARRRSSQCVHREVRQPGDARRADRQGLQPPRLAVPVPARRDRRGRSSASRPSAGRAITTRRRPTPPPPRIRPSTSASTMSSATSTRVSDNPAGAGSQAAAWRPPFEEPADGLQPWQFFVLAALGCATAVTFLLRGQGVTVVILMAVVMGATALVGIAALRTVRPLVTSHRGPHADDRRAHARGARAREDARAAVDQGARVRPRDGEAVGRGLPRDVGPPARARRTADAPARRGRRLSRAIERDLAKRLGEKAAAEPVARTCGTCSTAQRRRRAILQVVRAPEL